MEATKMKLRPWPGKPRRSIRYAAAAISAVASLLLAACGGSSGAAGGNSPSGSVSWFFWVGSPGEQAVWQHNASLVSQAYPNLSVQLTTTSWGNYWSKLPLEASTHSMPCIAGLSYGYVGSDANLFMPLNSLIKKYHFNLSALDPSMVRGMSVNGNVIALPYDLGPAVIAYNKALFKAKGVPDPQPGWTWSQFVQDARRLTGGGDYGFLPVDANEAFLSLELDYDLTGTPNAYVQHGTFNVTNPTFERGIQQEAELAYKDHVTPAYSSAPNWSTQEFYSGKIGMEVDGPWDLINFKQQANFPVGWAEMPAGPQGGHTYNEGSGFGITKDCKNPDAAFKALSVLVGPQAQSYAGSTGRALPARVAAEPSFAKFAGASTQSVLSTALRQQAAAQEVTTNWTAFQNALAQYTPLVLSGQISAATFASDVQKASGAGRGISPGDINSLLAGK
jgi:multiple sugar transport system substrate-binding protein